MPNFLVRIEGRDFPARLSDDGKDLGFFTTRYVEAEDVEAAELRAVGVIRSELLEWIGPPQEGDPTPMMTLDKVVEVDEMPQGGPGEGFTWYPMDEEE